MNTEITIHPKLQHYGLTTANLDAMIDWYRKVVGITVNHRSAVPAGVQGGRRSRPSRSPAMTRPIIASSSSRYPGIAADPDKSRHARVQHVAFEYQTLDDLLGTYVRLKGLGILPVFAFDEGFQAAVYYAGPRPEPRRAQRELLRQRLDGDGTPEGLAFHRSTSADRACRSREDDRGAQGGRLGLGTARAFRRRRVRSSKAVRLARNLLTYAAPGSGAVLLRRRT